MALAWLLFLNSKGASLDRGTFLKVTISLHKSLSYHLLKVLSQQQIHFEITVRDKGSSTTMNYAFTSNA